MTAKDLLLAYRPCSDCGERISQFSVCACGYRGPTAKLLDAFSLVSVRTSFLSYCADIEFIDTPAMRAPRHDDRIHTSVGRTMICRDCGEVHILRSLGGCACGWRPAQPLSTPLKWPAYDGDDRIRAGLYGLAALPITHASPIRWPL